MRVGTAVAEDDAALRRLSDELPSGGAVRLKLVREPSFFDALEVEGADSVVAKATAGDRIVGSGVMSFRSAFLNGAPEPIRIGYLGGMRLLPDFRGGRVLLRGYRLLDRSRGGARLSLTTILEDNRAARSLLESGRAGLPSYRPLGVYHTLTWRIGRHPWGSPPVEVRAAADGDVEAIVDFLSEVGPRRQFFPAFTAADLRSPTGLLRGLAATDILVARDGREIIGTLAVWDQGAFRRWVVDGYSPALAVARPIVNAYARLTGRPTLPPAGHALDYRFLSLLCVRGDRRDILYALLARAFAGSGLLCLGLHERDPLLPLVRRGRPHDLRSVLYGVHWADGEADFSSLDDRVPHVEVGSL
jgi:hypothetical protein